MVEAPGERLVIKLWETLVEKGIGSLLAPWQERRMSNVRIEQRAKEIRAIAHAQRRADLLLVQYPETHVSVGALTNVTPSVKPANAPPIDYESVAAELAQTDNLRRQVNLSNVLIETENILSEEVSSPPQESVDDDWLFRWRDHASRASKKEVQELWARLLAGQFKNPSAFSLRAVEFLKDVGEVEAKLIDQMKSFVISGAFIYRPGENEPKFFQLPSLMYLQELGIISGVEAGIFGPNWQVGSQSRDRSTFIVQAATKGLVIQKEAYEGTLSIPAYVVTRLGKEIFALSHTQPNVEYLVSILQEFARKGYTCLIGDARNRGDLIEIINAKAVGAS